MIDGLSAIDIVALSKCVSSKIYDLHRPKLRQGVYTPDLTVRVYGTFTVGAPYKQSERIDYALLLGMVMRGRPPGELERLALADSPPDAEALKASLKLMIATARHNPTIPCLGKVSANLMLAGEHRSNRHGKDRKPPNPKRKSNRRNPTSGVVRKRR